MKAFSRGVFMVRHIVHCLTWSPSFMVTHGDEVQV